MSAYSRSDHGHITTYTLPPESRRITSQAAPGNEKLVIATAVWMEHRARAEGRFQQYVITFDDGAVTSLLSGEEVITLQYLLHSDD